MNINLEITLAQEKVDCEGFDYPKLIDYFVEKKPYHTVALLIFQKVFKVDSNIARQHIYESSHYKNFKEESNPFNEDFING